jgi:hypothetical protein
MRSIPWPVPLMGMCTARRSASEGEGVAAECNVPARGCSGVQQGGASNPERTGDGGILTECSLISRYYVAWSEDYGDQLLPGVRRGPGNAKPAVLL